MAEKFVSLKECDFWGDLFGVMRQTAHASVNVGSSFK
jgi:hypothetical protein